MEKNILSIIADNPALFDALKEKVLSKFSLEEVFADPKVSNEQLGAMTRAVIQGAATVELAFREIEGLKSLPTPEEPKNPAR